ncbi:hypothetical protein BLNAU_6967 [Blattamonas nauphoetae]|uniref:Uncharacterized protein n=1 Tax=Blattamonas nauphoetae TaxID=2049346 RepID=A0ABQ9Y2T7_9EUKA|nr:hypothetical protein BLNAU_6967 [Blattamonas nauphoetae]
MLNAIPCPYEYNPKPDSMMTTSQESIRTQGMIPRDVFTPRIQNDIYRNIHPSSPQFDPVNWFTQHATQVSSQSVQKQPTKTKNKSTKLNLISRYNKHLGAINFADKHQKACLRAVENGLTLTQLRPIDSPTIALPTVSYPKTKVSLCEMMNKALDIERITIPNAASYNRHEIEVYNPQLDFLFQCCLRKEALTCFLPSNNAETKIDTNDDFVTRKNYQPFNRLEVVTSQLVPNHPPNTGFDSILLMFRYKKITHELHSLGVFFLKDATESNSDMTDKDVQLMKSWCSILKALYNLKRVQIFPSFIFMTDGINFPTSTPPNLNKLDSFIPTQNVWIAKFEAKAEVDIGDIGIRPMTTNTAPILARFIDLPVNCNPHVVRCSYCGSLVAENFPNHLCDEMCNALPAISINRELLYVLDRSNKPAIQTDEEHTQTDQRNQQTYCYVSKEITFQVIQPGTETNQKESQSSEPKNIYIHVDLVSTPAPDVIQHKKVTSGLWPTIQPTSRQKEYIQITCRNELPGTPDFYRLPFPPLQSTLEGTESTPNRSQSEDAQRKPNHGVANDDSTQELSESQNDPSNIIEAHCLWSEGFKLSYEKVGKSQYKVIKLAEQPYQSLEYDMPSVDITDHTLERQYMLPPGANARSRRVPVRSEQGTDPLRDKRIQYESFWQSLNRKIHTADLDSTLEKDETDMTERIRSCGNETEKSQLTCILTKGLLLRSRLFLQRGELEKAKLLLERSKQCMELNDTAEVEYELVHAHHREPETISHGYDELERAVANARNCFGINWEQWIQEGQGLPILLNPSFHILQQHLQLVQDHVETLGSCLETFEVEIPSKEGSSQDTLGSAHNTDEQHTNEARRAVILNTLLQALKEGLSLQLRIAWETGSWDQVTYFRNELKSINRISGDASVPPLPATFKSQTEQVKKLDIGVVTAAIRDILNTTHNYYHAKKQLLDNASASATLIHPEEHDDIVQNAPLLIDRLHAVIAECHQRLQTAFNEQIIKDLYEMIAKLNSLVRKTSRLEKDVQGKSSLFAF